MVAHQASISHGQTWKAADMTQAPYQWALTGSCPVCGAPIYGRVRKPGYAEGHATLEQEVPEARRTCPSSCPHSSHKAVEQ